MSKNYNTAEVQALLAKPARIMSINTKTGDSFELKNLISLVLLQNHNALVIQHKVDGTPKWYRIIASDAIADIVMEVEEVESAE